MSTCVAQPPLIRVREHADLRNVSVEQLKQLAAELRGDGRSGRRSVKAWSSRRLPLAWSNLTVRSSGVRTLRGDRCLDVGHQAYPNKILTGPAGAYTQPAPRRWQSRVLHRACPKANTINSARHIRDLDLGRDGNGGWHGS